MSCVDCSFTNVGRVTFSVATTEQSNNSTIGIMNTIAGGEIIINKMTSPGLQSLELIAEKVQIESQIDINLRADKHSAGGFFVTSSGSFVAGSGGINIYGGKLSINYQNLAITNTQRRYPYQSSWPYNLGLSATGIEINGNLHAASIALTSPDTIKINLNNKNNKLSTLSDVLVTSTRNNDFYAPLEGIFIQTFNSGDIGVYGDLLSDNNIVLKSTGDLTLRYGKVLSPKLSLIAGDWLETNGYIDSKLVEAAAKKEMSPAFSKAVLENTKIESKVFESIGQELTLAIKGLDKEIPGVTKQTPEVGRFLITDKQAYIDKVVDIYVNAGQSLHPEIKRRLSIHINDVMSGIGSFNNQNKLPGLHAEILAINSVLNQYTGNVAKLNLTNIKVVTKRLDKSDFGACTKLPRCFIWLRFVNWVSKSQTLMNERVIVWNYSKEFVHQNLMYKIICIW